MTARKVSVKAEPIPDPAVARVGLIALLVSMFSFFYYFQHHALVLYGDAVAHINIARRVVDSQTPGLLQLGTVWLPLPHLLMIPFIWSDALWRNATGGSIPSMVAYVLAVMGIFRLVRGILDANPTTKPAATVGAWAAAFVYGANPNLIYIQATAMTESLYLAFFIWAVVYFAEFIRTLQTPVSEPPAQQRSSLLRCALCLAAAELTRYDGWFLAAIIGATVIVIVLRRWQNRDLRWNALKFLVAITIAPVLWLAYNSAVYGNAARFCQRSIFGEGD